MTTQCVKAIFRYPVKSMIGEQLDQTEITEWGIPGDRGWAVRDEKRGGIRGGKKIPQLMTLAATSTVEGAMIAAPDGETMPTNALDINEWLSTQLNHPVSLWPLLPADQLDHYRRGAPDTDDFEEELRTVFGRLPGEPIPDLTASAVLLEFESPPGTYFDAFPLMLLTQQSLDTMNQLAPESDFDVRRFRPNVLIDCQDNAEPFPEQAWVGKNMTIGGVTLKIESTCPRCAMTTHGFSDLPRDTQIMRQMVAHSEGNLGVYATILQSGTVTAKDRVYIQGSGGGLE